MHYPDFCPFDAVIMGKPINYQRLAEECKLGQQVLMFGHNRLHLNGKGPGPPHPRVHRLCHSEFIPLASRSAPVPIDLIPLLGKVESVIGKNSRYTCKFQDWHLDSSTYGQRVRATLLPVPMLFAEWP